MSSFFALFLVVLLLHTVSPAPVKPPAGWTLLKAADPKEMITVTLAVKQANREWLDTTLRSVSYPDSPYYGQHKTLEEIATHVHAHPESVAAVKKLFQSVNVEASFTIGEGFAVADIPIEIAEQLFSAKFYQFQYKDKSDVTTTRTLGFTVPSYLKPHVDFVCCMDQFPEPERKTKLRSYGLPQVTPNSIDKSYNILGAFATGFVIYVDGMVETVGGTSCAAPTTAGIISLINDVRLNEGKSTVGFLNPLIYKLNGKGFFDITKGENYGNNIFCDGFKAIEGWDPASGWGSPNFGILKGLLN
uniref:Peptidase S53 domain-containing protein n=1 Tax=Amphimedon queenslandica TaxID=400682 RepID=A0A1X7UID4_AMPQE